LIISSGMAKALLLTYITCPNKPKGTCKPNAATTFR